MVARTTACLGCLWRAGVNSTVTMGLAIRCRGRSDPGTTASALVASSGRDGVTVEVVCDHGNSLAEGMRRVGLRRVLGYEPSGEADRSQTGSYVEDGDDISLS